MSYDSTIVRHGPHVQAPPQAPPQAQGRQAPQAHNCLRVQPTGNNRQETGASDYSQRSDAERDHDSVTWRGDGGSDPWPSSRLEDVRDPSHGPLTGPQALSKPLSEAPVMLRPTYRPLCCCLHYKRRCHAISDTPGGHPGGETRDSHGGPPLDPPESRSDQNAKSGGVKGLTESRDGVAPVPSEGSARAMSGPRYGHASVPWSDVERHRRRTTIRRGENYCQDTDIGGVSA